MCHERVFADEVDVASFFLGGPVIAGRRGGGRLGHEGLLVDAAEPGIGVSNFLLALLVKISFTGKNVQKFFWNDRLLIN